MRRAQVNLNQLFIRACQGDKIAEDEIFSHLRARFVFIAKRRIRQVDAEDIAHDACLTILDKYHSLEPDIQFEAWAYQVLRNKIGNYFRRDRVKQRLQLHLSNLDVVADTSTVDPDMLIRLVTCLRKLVKVNARYAKILNLLHIGYSTDEICRRLKINRSNMYSIVSRARKMLRDCIFGEGE